MILFSHNKTASWLDKQSSKNKEELLQVARTLAPTIKKKYVERKKEIEKRCEENLTKRQEEIARLQRTGEGKTYSRNKICRFVDKAK